VENLIHIFRYDLRHKVKSVLLLSALLTAFVFMIPPYGSGWPKIGLAFLVTNLLLWLIFYPYYFNEQIEVHPHRLIRKRRLGTSVQIPFEQTRRLLIQQKKNPLAGNYRLLTIFASTTSTHVILTGLSEEDKLIALLQQKAIEYDLRLLLQSKNGTITPVPPTNSHTPHG